MASERLLTATPMCWILRIMALLLGKMRGTSLLLSPRNPGVSPPKENVGAEGSRVSLRSLGGGLRSWLAVRGTCTRALNLTAPPLLRLAAHSCTRETACATSRRGDPERSGDFLGLGGDTPLPHPGDESGMSPGKLRRAEWQRAGEGRERSEEEAPRALGSPRAAGGSLQSHEGGGEEAVGDIGCGGGGGDGENPGPHDSRTHVPVHLPPPLGETHPEDGGGDDVGGADGNPQRRRRQDPPRGGRLRAEAVHGLQLHEVAPHRLDDPPPPGRRAERHRGGAG